jgi:hypothetical protein
MHDMMIMVKGRPSGAIILASGSTFGFSIGVLSGETGDGQARDLRESTI